MKKAFIVTKESLGGYDTETFVVIADNFGDAERFTYECKGYGGKITNITEYPCDAVITDKDLPITECAPTAPENSKEVQVEEKHENPCIYCHLRNSSWYGTCPCTVCKEPFRDPWTVTCSVESAANSCDSVSTHN